MELPALAVDATTPAARRDAYRELSEESLADRLCAWMLDLRRVDAEALAAYAQLPVGEVIASPFALRAIALGVECGVTSVHRELRALLPWSFGVHDPDHGVWDRGALHVGKYQSFQAEAPFATFDPLHDAKWAPHEFLHRALGFFFRPTMSRFELYLGARINELLPVATWYGHDQVARLRDVGGFVRGQPQDADPAHARWWVEDEASLRERARHSARWLHQGLRHFEDERAAIASEMQSGVRVPTPRTQSGAILDASSDAMAYVAGHWDRLQTPATQRILARVPHAATVEELLERLDEVHDRLLFSPLTLDEDPIGSQRAARMSWDWLLRLAVVDPESDLASEERPLEDVEGWRARIETEDAGPLVLADGLEGLCLQQQHEGIESVAPRTASLLAPEDLMEFASAIPARGSLVDRVRAFVATKEAWRAELFALEALIAAPARESSVPYLCDEDGDWVRRGEGYVVFTANHDVVALHAGETDSVVAREGAWLVGAKDGDIVILEISAPIQRLWTALGEAPQPVSSVVELLGDEGFAQLQALNVLGLTRVVHSW